MPTGRRVAEKTKRLSITLPADVVERVEALAYKRRVPVGSILREFTMAGIDRQALVERLANAVENVA